MHWKSSKGEETIDSGRAFFGVIEKKTCQIDFVGRHFSHLYSNHSVFLILIILSDLYFFVFDRCLGKGADFQTPSTAFLFADTHVNLFCFLSALTEPVWRVFFLPTEFDGAKRRADFLMRSFDCLEWIWSGRIMLGWVTTNFVF